MNELFDALAAPARPVSPPPAEHPESVCRDAGRSRRSVAIQPVPYLLNRARNLATRDFLSLLQDLLSDEAIGALKKGK
jgi:hypothetical protein